jgi:hypothetical protein
MIAASVRLLHLFAYVYLVTFLFVLFGTSLEVSGAIPFGPTRLPMLITFVWRGPIIATPLVIGAAWWMRVGGSEPTTTWRARALVAALVLVTTNAAMCCGWMIYYNVLIAGDTDGAGAWTLVSLVAEWLVIPALLLALVGKGPGRILLVCASICGFMLWVVPAIL